MGELCDKLLCDKVLLYRNSSGKDVSAHRDACVVGHCPKFEQKQRLFFDCPRHKTSPENASSTAHVSPEEELKWEAFVPVDDKGVEIRPSQRQGNGPAAPAPGSSENGDEEWEPQPTSTGTTPRKVRAKTLIAVVCTYIPHEEIVDGVPLGGYVFFAHAGQIDEGHDKQL